MVFLFGSCPQCHQPLPETNSYSGEKRSCTYCGTPSELVVFPAMRAGVKKEGVPESVGSAGESSCLYHAGNKASSICSVCGAFICRLCEIHLQADPICPACLERQAQGGKSAVLRKSHYLWDNISLALAILVPGSLAFWFLSLFSAPCALFLALRHWNGSGVLRRPSKIRLGLAVLLSLLQIGGWCLLFLYLFNAFSKLPASD